MALLLAECSEGPIYFIEGHGLNNLDPPSLLQNNGFYDLFSPLNFCTHHSV